LIKLYLVSGQNLLHNIYFCLAACTVQTISAILNWFFKSVSSEYSRPSYSVYLFIQWFESPALLFTARLLCLCLDIWNERNSRLFKNIENFIPQLLDKVKYYSFLWLKGNMANFVYSFERWWSNPFMCSDIGQPFCVIFVDNL